uniref:Uncharacterized protein n=1 Tax=Compsopogon caeruleus TaxID=31354 RepID=A0A7S1XF55_9RHOD|mmetsp:Transcript_759/g.1591  ORF Transcript_759/g.1591 Transcript_759/m.1591 type:complete len:147 (+) Transcript_759:69-509(+)
MFEPPSHRDFTYSFVFGFRHEGDTNGSLSPIREPLSTTDGIMFFEKRDEYESPGDHRASPHIDQTLSFGNFVALRRVGDIKRFMNIAEQGMKAFLETLAKPLPCIPDAPQVGSRLHDNRDEGLFGCDSSHAPVALFIEHGWVLVTV